MGKSGSENFRKINLKKKVFCSRGFKKTNVRQFKRTAWKQKFKGKTNVCYLCGGEGHWANACPNKDQMRDALSAHQPLSNDPDELDGILDDDLDFASMVLPIVSPILPEDGDYTEIIDEALAEFGFEQFRHYQRKTIERILRGQSTLLISSTGSGKSLCYQLPAYVQWKHKKYITLVVSPLISLMEDQLVNLPKPMSAVCLHSGLKMDKKESNLNALRKGTAQVLFISPEFITGGSNFRDLATLPLIGFACIDEAHCLSEWSHNFRPSYLQLYRALVDKLNIKTFLALTATATYETCVQITKNLGITRNDILGITKIPPNLILSVSRDTDKDTALIELLKSKKMRNLESIIVYCTRRDDTVRLAQYIRTSMQNIKCDKKSDGWDARPYHAGLPPDEKNRVQNGFIKGKVRVVVATIAFGMGINKSNVRAIIHYNLPKSFESYVQEIGRAGRDDSLAYCHLFLDPLKKDLFELKRYIFSNSCERTSVEKLVQRLFKKCKCDTIGNQEEEDDDDSINEADCDENMDKENLNSSSKVNCPGHEVAIPIDDLTMDLDMKEENILTLISFIELNYPEKQMTLLPSSYSHCKLLSYVDGFKGLNEMSRQCPPVAVAMALRPNKSEETNLLEFNYIEIASMLGIPSSEVRRQLRSLEWIQLSDGRKTRGKARIELTKLSIRVKVPGNLKQFELESIIQFLYNYVSSQERIEINRLDFIYDTFTKFSLPTCIDKIDLKKSNQLKETLNKYFSHGFQEGDCVFNLKTILNPTNSNQIKPTEKLQPCDIDQIHRDIRHLLNMHHEYNWTPRAVARILQGISSPRFPAEIWGKAYQFWRAHVNLDFNILFQIADEEIKRIDGKC
ncbi:ATP-dependent DNA helicase Q4-like [Panonychus citri]|uniref:ATP-dependent DNA helicase Q4-like n=1 Tax=Panonychus citri TaxID=50023 RepID=UPI002307C5CA|nr:ATP-dependent DNA helicase Q4-like [Panonychus citri]